MNRKVEDHVVLELRLSGPKPTCRALIGDAVTRAPHFTQRPSFAHVLSGSTAELLPLGSVSVPVEWAVPQSEPESQAKRRVFDAVGILLAKLPPSHVAPLKMGGIRFFKGERSLGGYYEIKSSFINVNVGVHPTILITSLLHEMGHLVHFEASDPQSVKKFVRNSWLQLGPFRVRKFWRNPASSFLTPYSATSPEEDFAECYAAYVAGLYSKEEWLGAAFGEPLRCPACGAQAFVLDPLNADAGICGGCDKLFKRSDNRWAVAERGVVASRRTSDDS